MNQQQRNKEIINYLVFGVLTTLVNVVSFYLLDRVLGWQYLWANAFSIVISILFAYTTNKRFVFKSNTVNLREMVMEFTSFVSFRLLSGIIDMISMWLLVDIITIDTLIAKLFTQFVVVGLNYIFSKFFVFKNK